MTAAEGALPGFSDRVLRFLERVEHRIARTDSEREAAFRLRYDAYVRNGLMERPFRSQALRSALRQRRQRLDHHDLRRWGTGGDHEAEPGDRRGFRTFPAWPSIPTWSRRDCGLGSRSSKRRDWRRISNISGSNPELAYLAMRPGYMAATHFDIDLAVASPRLEHMAFYRRVLQFVPWCEPRPYPGLTAKFGCMGADFQEARERVETRYPFYRSTRSERDGAFRAMRKGGRPRFPINHGAVRHRIGAELSTA